MYSREGRISCLETLIVLLIVLMMFSSAFFVFGPQPPDGSNSGMQLSASPYDMNNHNIDSILVRVPFAAGSISAQSGVHYLGNARVMVSFNLSNQSALNRYLANLSNSSSPLYHRYMTREQFTSHFSVSGNIYSSAVSYFSSFPGLKVKQYADRISLMISGNSTSLGKAFNTTLLSKSIDSHIYYASSPPELPDFIGKHVSEVSGLTNSPFEFNLNMGTSSISIHGRVNSQNGYPSPYNSSGVQYIYGPDLQKAYDETGLLNITYPTNEVIATVLWSGNDSSGQNVSPFYKSNVCSYFNTTLPSYEPHPHVFGAPINGAPYPGPSAQNDRTGANEENTLDLEMVGSMAPGSTIYNVYGPSPTLVNLLGVYAFILNPNSTAKALTNVSVITNSWGASAFQNITMKQYLEESQARGITVLASSGDSGDNPKSTKYSGSVNSFPALCSYDSFGVTSVGGTTLTLNSHLGISSQTAWNISSADVGDSGPAGSAGGICTQIPEPSWEINTSANRVIQGKGLGIPDLSAIANNTLVCITLSGTTSDYVFWGTSIASPVTAGMVAEMDAVLKYYNDSNIGFMNPVLFNLSSLQLQALAHSSTTGAIVCSSYNSSLPMQVVYNVDTGNNFLYVANYGYNIVTGWGSLNDYNFTSFVLSRNFNYRSFAMDGVQAVMNLSGLNVTSYLFNSTSGKYSVNTNFNASIQENMFLANSLGAPIYWIQNVIYISGYQRSGWVVNYTGWTIDPFYGLYPSSSIYSYNFPAGKLIHFPHDFRITTWLTNYTTVTGQRMDFSINNQTISLPVPGAKYIIGEYNYTYEWNGLTYYDGPYPDNPNPGGLVPQVGLVGGPSLGIGNFTAPTGGTLKFTERPMGSNSYISGITKPFNNTVDQTGETSNDLVYSPSANNSYVIEIKGNSNQQGIMIYQKPGYSVTFNESGLPDGFPWYVNVTGFKDSGPITSTQYTVTLQNGSYDVEIQSQGKLYSASYNSSFSVNDSNLMQQVVFTPYLSKVTFVEKNLPVGTEWFVNLTSGKKNSSSTSSIGFSLLNGTYTFNPSTADKNLRANSSTFEVTGHASSILVDFVPELCDVNFTETGLPHGATWFINITNFTDSGSITSNSYSVFLQNGTYNFTAQTADRAYHPVYNSTFRVSGNTPVRVEFLPTLYSTRFTEKGIPYGSMWYLNLTGSGLHNSSTGQCLNISLMNGTYSYIASSFGNERFMSNGSFTVNGFNRTVSVNFSRAYSIVFLENGLASGVKWYVNISNGMNGVSVSGQNITMYLSNGSYTYQASSDANSYHLLYNRSFNVSGSTVHIEIKFIMASYTVTFSETGLSNGTAWNVEINLVNVSSTSHAFQWGDLTNGTYSFTVYAKGYQYNGTSTFTVNGKNVTVHVEFQKKGQASDISALLIVIPVIGALVIALFYLAFRKKKW